MLYRSQFPLGHLLERERKGGGGGGGRQHFYVQVLKVFIHCRTRFLKMFLLAQCPIFKSRVYPTPHAILLTSLLFRSITFGRQNSQGIIRELKQTDAASVNQQISIQKDSRPSEFSRPLTSFTVELNGNLNVTAAALVCLSSLLSFHFVYKTLKISISNDVTSVFHQQKVLKGRTCQ